MSKGQTKKTRETAGNRRKLTRAEKKHSEDAFKHLKGDNKELLIIPGANHTDLYDRMIPFDKLEAFFKSNLK